MALLLTVLIIALIAVLAFWIVDRVGLPDPLNWIAKAIVGIMALVALISETGVLHFSG